MEVIKIDIQTKANLTLLAKAYWDKLFPLATYGQLYYEQDLSNYNFPVRYLYFKDDYYEELTQHINNSETLSKIELSNSPNEWSYWVGQVLLVCLGISYCVLIKWEVFFFCHK